MAWSRSVPWLNSGFSVKTKPWPCTFRSSRPRLFVKRPRHVQQRLENHVRSLIRQFRIDGRLGRVAIPAQTTGGGKQADVIGIEESPSTFERPVLC